jgi:uncharacterized protein with HEPN domain
MQHDPAGIDADRLRLRHMLSAARQGMAFVQGRTRNDLDMDDMLRRAVVSAIQEIGEAAVRISPGGRARVSGVPWADVIRMRNILVHVYWGVDLDRVWKTAIEDLPVLATALEAALDEWPEPPVPAQP